MLQASCTCRSSCVMRAVCSDESWQGLQAPCSTSCGAGAAQCQGIWGSDPQSKPRGAAASRLCSSGSVCGTATCLFGADTWLRFCWLRPTEGVFWGIPKARQDTCWGVGGKLGRGISKQVHQNSPSSHMFRCTLPQKSDRPGTEKGVCCI